ncbi:MAG: hypothetical protein HFJ17_03230 [Clostridia bacterium]|nr:hypothetical protein [Clostridia bacterium]
MKVLSIEQNETQSKLKALLNIVSNKENKIIIYKELEKSDFKTKQKIIKKIIKILNKNKNNKVILMPEIKKDRDFINLLYSNKINISNDRWLFKVLIDEVIEKIMKDRKKEESEIWITVNDVDNITQNIIYKFAREFKRVNIITNHISKFKNIENKLYEDDGIMLTITNNRRKSLLKANLILNIDFPKELINQFTIFDQATIVNIEGGISIKKKRFSGKIINDIEIGYYENEEITNFINENHLQKYDIRDVCDVLQIVPKCDIILT